MRLKALTASPNRVVSESCPSRRNSSSTGAYWAVSVSTATPFQFFAALRTIAGPPMSMFSIASSSVQPGRATVASNGYRLTTSRSIRPIACPASASICAGTSRRASNAPCTRGCSVLTRPSNISGNPVNSATSVTCNPCDASKLAVPPVETSPIPSDCKAAANSTIPVLSETERSAFMRRWLNRATCARPVSCAGYCGSVPAIARHGIGSGQLVA